MPCYNPLPIKNNNRKSSSDYLVNFVPCGKCIGCLQRRRDGWSNRIKEEWKVSELSTFLTLTYDDDHVPIKILGYKKDKKYIKTWESYVFLPLVKKDLQNYFKRVRAVAPGLRYYACGEYGSKGNRPHFHGIVFNVSRDILVDKWSDKNGPIGFVSCDNVSDADIHYVTKYITNNDNSLYPSKEYKPFQLMSKGLGKAYIDVAKNYQIANTSPCYTSSGGIKSALPRYYTDNIFTKEARQKLGAEAIQKALVEMQQMEEKYPGKRIKLLNAKIYRSLQTSKSKKV